MRTSLPWSPQQKEEQPPLSNDVLESSKSSGKHKDSEFPEQAPKKSRQKIEKDVGSRWVAPIILVITILVSLLLKLFDRN